MVATTIALPNIRKFFIPDPGFIICEADLSGSDAQVVAWEADDADLKAAFRAGLKIHIKNARDVYPERTKNMSDADLKATDQAGGLYHNMKRMVHGTNFVGTAKYLAHILKMSVRDVDDFQYRWFSLHPGIPAWHDRTEQQLMTTRIITNPFGYRIMYFDRIENTLKKAVAWIPQSVTAHCRTRAMLNIEAKFSFLQLLLEVHDSIVFQIPKEMKHMLPQIKKALEVVVPYPDPLIIPWSIATSEKSWGDAV